MSTLQEFETLVTPFLKKEGYILVQTINYQHHGQCIVQVMIERIDEKEISFSDCKKATRIILKLLDVQDPIGGDYNVEVSSTGVERPLIRPEDFCRFNGHLSKITLKEKLVDSRQFEGVIRNPTSEKVTIEDTKSKDLLTFEYNNIKSAHLLMEKNVKELIEIKSN